MTTNITVAITGDSIINRRLSVRTEERFLSLIKILRAADVAYTHLETLVHDYDGPEVYPAAEPGSTPMRSPRFVVDELKWAGFDLVSHASNHCLDYSYGGLMSTWKALDDAGLPHAGTGRNLAEAREPAYLDTAKGRVALISMCSTFTGWARAGETGRDVKGRPGLNPLRFYYVVDADTLELLKRLADRLGWRVSKVGKTWWFGLPGSVMSRRKFVEGDKPGISTVVEEDDAEGNLRSIKDAARQADYVLVHLHSHLLHQDKSLDIPPNYVPPFAKACIDAGAHVFISQGSHTPLRGIEIYKGKAIFYDPGDFILMSKTVTRLPADYYTRPEFGPEVPRWEATPADGFDARETHPKPVRPPGGAGFVVAVVSVCSLGEEGRLTEMKLYPVTIGSKPRSRCGLPWLADLETGKKIITHLAKISEPFGTRIQFKDGVGVVKL